MHHFPWITVVFLVCLVPRSCYSTTTTSMASTTTTSTTDRCFSRRISRKTSSSDETDEEGLATLSVSCVFERWHANPAPLAKLQHGDIINLRVKLLKHPSRLTPDHLRGMRRLERLTIIGSCRKPDKCEDCGLLNIGKSTFKEIPELKFLSLSQHPMTELRDLEGLSKLTRLTIKRMPKLNWIRKSALDPIRGSIEHMEWNEIGLYWLSSSLFTNMNRLQTFTYVGLGGMSYVGSHLFSNLRGLQSIYLNSVVLQSNVLENLPKLRELSLFKVRLHRTMRSHRPNKKVMLCNLTNSNIRFVSISLADFRLLQLCKGIFNCHECGEHPRESPQRVRLFVSFGVRLQPLASVLPPGNSKLNISELEVINYPINSIETELSRMPLLRKLEILNLPSDPSNPRSSEGTFLKQLTVNPLQSHPSPRLLVDVRLFLNVCDCTVLDMIQWFPKNAAPGANLKLNCKNFRCKQNGCSTRMMWQDLRNITKALKDVCSAKSVKSDIFHQEAMCSRACEVSDKNGISTWKRRLSYYLRKAQEWLLSVIRKGFSHLTDKKLPF